MSEEKSKRKNEDVENTSVFQQIVCQLAGLILIGSFLFLVLAVGKIIFPDKPAPVTPVPIVNEIGPNCSIELSQMEDSLRYRVGCKLLLEGTATIIFYQDGQVIDLEGPNIGMVYINGPFIETAGNVPIPSGASSACVDLQLENSPRDTLCRHIR